MRPASLLLIGALVCGGCATATEGDRLIMEQEYHIGNFVLANAEKEEVKQAGRDATENAKTLMENLGSPENPAGQYTPDLSKKYRDQSKDEHAAESGFIGMLKGIATSAGFPWAATALTAIMGGVTFIRKQVQGRKLQAVYEGVNNVLGNVKGLKNGSGNDLPEFIKSTLGEAAKIHKIYTEIRSDLRKLKSEGEIKEA